MKGEIGKYLTALHEISEETKCAIKLKSSSEIILFKNNEWRNEFGKLNLLVKNKKQLMNETLHNESVAIFTLLYTNLNNKLFHKILNVELTINFKGGDLFCTCQMIKENPNICCVKKIMKDLLSRLGLRSVIQFQKIDSNIIC
jgi:nucleoside-triphosphatase THEP1